MGSKGAEEITLGIGGESPCVFHVGGGSFAHGIMMRCREPSRAMRGPPMCHASFHMWECGDDTDPNRGTPGGVVKSTMVPCGWQRCVMC